MFNEAQLNLEDQGAYLLGLLLIPEAIGPNIGVATTGCLEVPQVTSSFPLVSVVHSMKT
jgi:hypothetical protein